MDSFGLFGSNSFFMRGNDAELIGLFGISPYVVEGRLWTI
jgi:hypothetical protein